jgi:hypothetical protein
MDMNKQAAAKTTATEILSKQKGIQALRKQVAAARTKVNDAKRSIKDYTNYLKDSTNPEHIKGLIARHEAELAKAEPKLAQAQAELAAAEAALPASKPTEFDVVLRWFSGVALAKAKEALELVDASVAHGSWIPGASRRVWAALKPNVAKKTIKVNSRYDAPRSEQAIDSAIRYGSFGGVARLTLQDATRELSDDALEFFIDFKPLIDTLTKLDATRPVPVFTTMNASPTVSAELKRQGAASVEVAEIVFEEREGTDKNGRKYFYRVAKIVWPEGTQHNTSRYAYGTCNNSQCHACGHAIRNSFNWVPLVLTTEAGEKKSLWVGRDCAETLFGVKMDGELELAEGQR